MPAASPSPGPCSSWTNKGRSARCRARIGSTMNTLLTLRYSWLRPSDGSTIAFPRGDGASWSALGTGMNANVRALALDGVHNLYAGGVFTTAGGTSSSYIARWGGESCGVVSVVEPSASVPSLQIGTPRPNPARRNVGIEFQIPLGATVSAQVFDIAGRQGFLTRRSQPPAGRPTARSLGLPGRVGPVGCARRVSIEDLGRPRDGASPDRGAALVRNAGAAVASEAPVSPGDHQFSSTRFTA